MSRSSDSSPPISPIAGARSGKAFDSPPAQSGDEPERPAVDTLASLVLASLAARPRARDAQDNQVDPALLDRFCARILRPEPPGRLATSAPLRDAGVGVEMILEGYLPEAARRLGDMWLDDRLGFAEVTIAMTRLQALLHELSQPSLLCPPNDGSAPSLMMIVPLEEQHSLGSMAAAAHLRRLGASVCLCLGQSNDEIMQKISSRQFDMVAISAANSEKLEIVRELVRMVRGAMRAPAPVVIGGNVVARMPDAKALTGADFATTDPREALRAFGLRLRQPAHVPLGGERGMSAMTERAEHAG